MEGSSKADPGPAQGRTRTMSGPGPSPPLEKLHSQTDSILTAARLIRNGWTEEGKFSHISCSVGQPPLSKHHDNQRPKHSDRSLEEPARRRDLEVSSRRTAEDRRTSCGNTVGERGVSADTERHPCQAGIVCVRVASCRTACRQSRRLKAPILPVIAEM